MGVGAATALTQSQMRGRSSKDRARQNRYGRGAKARERHESLSSWRRPIASVRVGQMPA